MFRFEQVRSKWSSSHGRRHAVSFSNYLLTATASSSLKLVGYFFTGQSEASRAHQVIVLHSHSILLGHPPRSLSWKESPNALGCSILVNSVHIFQIYSHSKCYCGKNFSTTSHGSVKHFKITSLLCSGTSTRMEQLLGSRWVV